MLTISVCTNIINYVMIKTDSWIQQKETPWLPFTSNMKCLFLIFHYIVTQWPALVEFRDTTSFFRLMLYLFWWFAIVFWCLRWLVWNIDYFMYGNFRQWTSTRQVLLLIIHGAVQRPTDFGFWQFSLGRFCDVIRAILEILINTTW